MQANTLQGYIDYFKLFKVFDLKKIEKVGLVKIVQDKILNRKILSVEGNISTANYITFSTSNYPNISFSERYLYVQGFADAGKSFCMQIACCIGNKHYKAVYSSLYKTAKKHLQNIIHLPLTILPQKWTITVIDLFQLGQQFGMKPQEMKMIFRVTAVEVRASSKVKGIFQSDYLFSIDKIPKDMMLPLKKEENYFQKYHYFVVTNDETLIKQTNVDKQAQKEILESKKVINKPNEKQGEKKLNRNSTGKLLQKQDEPIEERSKSQQPKEKEKEKEKNKTKQSKHSKHKNHLPPSHSLKPKQTKDHPQIVNQDQQEQQPQQHEQMAPQPQGTISMSLSCLQGFTLHKGTITTIQSYIFKPSYMPTHKQIQIVCSCDPYNTRIITGYNDGSICLWDTIRKEPLNYFMTELNQIRVMLVDQSLTFVIIGLDKMKREVINIVSNNSVIFRQISNFNISTGVLVLKTTFEHGLLTLGYENIRLWRVNNQTSIIQGSSIYLGQTSRKVKYTSAIVIKTAQDYLAFITDSNGFITTISISQAKMIQSFKVDQHPLDHIIQLQHQTEIRALISNEMGVLKIINLERMEVLQELNINSRIKQIEQLPDSSEIILTHYNKSIGSINLQSGLYSFLMRSHTAPIIKIIYNQHYNKVISLSKDTSIRIWQYVISEGSLPFRLQEQYEFIITGQELSDAVCSLEGKAEDMKFIVVGGDSGKLRKIDIESYSIKEEIMLETGSMRLSTSRNGKYILCTYESGNSYLLDNNFTLIYKYLLNRGEKKKTKNWHNGFNQLTKQYFIQNLEEDRLQFYSLKQTNQSIFCISNANISSISAINDKIFIVGSSQLRIYQRQTMIQVINFDKSQVGCMDQKTHVLSYPILCFAMESKIMIQGIMSPLHQQIQLPERVSNLSLIHNQQKQEGKIFCSGVDSFAIYTISYQLHNLSSVFYQLSTLSQQTLKEQAEQPTQEVDISFSKTTLSAFTNQPRKNAVKSRKIESQPKELKKLYEQQQQLYEQVKQHLVPRAFQELPSNEQQPNEQVQKLQLFQDQNNGISILLQYGYQLRQNARDEKQVGTFFWISQNNSMILQTGNNKDILQHFFSVPIRHKLVSFPSTISSLTVSLKSYESIKYLAVCVNSLIKIYNVYEELSYIRTIESLSTTLPNNVIYECGMTNCNRYLLALSYNQIQADSKIYIHLIEIVSGSVVSSSYLPLPAPKNKYKNTQLKQIKQYKLLINPFKTSLEFIIYHPQGILHFYRITSIFTLQTMQLQELLALSRDKVNYLTAACFINIGEKNFEDSVIALGSDNGSLVLIDTRTANILIACIGLIPNTAITSISFSKQSQEETSKLILFTNSTNLVVFNLFHGINSILSSMQHLSSTVNQTQIKRLMTLDGEVTAFSNIANQSQQLVITKCGSLWLLDYNDFVTVKISTIHTNNINKAEIVSSNSGESFLFTCSDDGCMKISNLVNLEQTIQIYKPRKQVKTFNLNGSFTLVSFGQEIFIYNQINPDSMTAELTSLGSFKLDALILDIQNIPTTDNYYILTETEIIIVYLASRQIPNKSQATIRSFSRLSQNTHLTTKQIEVQVEIQKITDVQHPFKLIINQQFAPYDQFALLTKPGKSAVWSRKCLKRNYNPIEELSNVHELSYYLIDATFRSSTELTYLKFISQNQYLWGLLQQGLVQIRNYREHAIVKEINFTFNQLTTMTCIGNQQFTLIAGDQNGYIYILNENGLLIERIKAMQCSITGIKLWQYQKRKMLVAYGSKYAVIIANTGIK